MKRFLMLIQRELWEHRSLWMTPAIIGIILLLLIGIVGHVSLPGMPGFDGAISAGMKEMPKLSVWNGMLFALSVIFFLASSILMVVYLLDCLYAERRDRSILFWRSLPVSDRATVFAKLATGVLVIPLLSFAALSVTALLGTLVLKLRLGGEWTSSPYMALRPLSALRAEIVILLSMLISVLWYAPYAAYLLLVSAWARRSIFAWAFVPPVLVALIEKLVFGTSHFGHIVLGGFREFATAVTRISHQLDAAIGDYFAGWPDRSGGASPGPGSVSDSSFVYSSTHLWIGLALAAVMVWAAIWLRRRSEDS